MIDLFGNSTEVKPAIQRNVLAERLKNNLQCLKVNDFVKLLTNEFNEIIQYVDLSNGEKCCQKTSLLFNPHRLEIKTKSSKYSIFDALKTDSFISGLARAVLFKKTKVNELLYQVLQLGINGIQYVNEFPPFVARDIYLEYGLDMNSKILDPCAGWGGRMIGASVVSNNYECFEPSTKTFEGLWNLYDFIKSMNPGFVAKIHKKGFECSNLEFNTYDFALTSPPYFDTEVYSNEDTNSLVKFNTFDKWCEGFYLPLVEKTMNYLKPGKTFMINIGSRIYPLNDVLTSNFSDKYEINKKGNYLSGNGGLGKEGEGEMFYSIKKPEI